MLGETLWKNDKWGKSNVRLLTSLERNGLDETVSKKYLEDWRYL